MSNTSLPTVGYYPIRGRAQPIRLLLNHAIMRHLARKHGLVATDETGLVRQDVLEQQLADILYGLANGLLFDKDYETLKIKYLAETLPQQLDELSRFLGTRQWFTRNHINYVDFMGYELLDWLREFSASTFNKYQNFVQYMNRFESLPAIKAYMKSPELIRTPFGPYIQFDYRN
ncbi:unnamed protein product [Medioppia subpectinata]|uniref:glutathione transferase n=1 Tax=Medioppia subpectinata TaxID=1979941 RepID=A0A7R9KYZ8_9ACAR|nr:unnamed protein product [Medioppia subpectinata]CAG2111211.1 unnamed protein product [Medioppia subpectinata]